MNEWHNIQLRDFWDVPRAILAQRGTEQFYFSSRFDDELDDYTDYYEVFRLPLLSEEERKGSWVGFELRAIEKLDRLPLKALPFDVNRQSVRDESNRDVRGKLEP